MDSEAKPVETASSKDSIWRDVQLATFRKNVTELQQIQEVPGTKVKHSGADYQNCHRIDVVHILSFDREKALADDFAMIASIEPIVQYVTAVSLEESLLHNALMIRLASNGAITESTRSLVSSVLKQLRTSASRGASLQVCQADLFRLIVDAHRQRIHGKLQSLVWKRPKHLAMKAKAPLYQQLAKMIKTSQGWVISSSNQDLIMSYSKLCESGDQCVSGTDAELKLLQDIVAKSHELCLSLGKGIVSSRLMQTKEMLRVKKLARYWTACDGMADASKRYAALFKRVELRTLAPYESIPLPSKPGFPMVKCHVHAEVQLLCSYALDPKPEVVTPRVIGVSKSACYLCNLFFSKYDRFYISSSHGKLYHQWTVPDTFIGSSLQNQRQKVRQVLSQVNGEVSRALDRWRKRKPNQFVPYPNESYATMPGVVERSALPSEVSSRQSHLSSSSTITASSSQYHPAFDIAAPPSSIAAPPSSIAAPALNVTVPPKITTPPPSPKNINDLSAGNVAASGISQPQDGRSPDDDDYPYLGSPRVSSPSDDTRTAPHRQKESNAETPEPLSTPRSPPPPYVRGPPPSILDVWEYPVEAPVTADRPITTHAGNMHISLSVEAGVEGIVEVSDLPRNEGHATLDAVDVQCMRVGEDRLLRRDGNEGSVEVYLQNGKAGRLVQVSLRWR